ncbi:MAG: tetratricopeptide repeat protein [Candidatus Obscuribacterales bacterium]
MPYSSRSVGLTALSALILLAQGAASQPAKAAAEPADEANWTLHSQKGVTAYKELRYGEADREFRAALVEAEKFGPDDIRLAQTLTNLGVLLEFRGHLDKAQPLFERAVKIKQKTLGPFNTDTVDSASSLCIFYLKRKQTAKAHQLCDRIIEYGEKQVAELNNLRASFKHLESFYSHHKGLEESREQVIAARDKTLPVANNDFLELAVHLDRMGSAYEAYPVQGKHGHSEKLYKLALNIRERILSGNHLALAASYDNLGKLYAQEGRHSLASPLLKKAFDLTRNTIGMAKPQTYQRLEAWSKTLDALGKHSQAESLYRQALNAFAEGYGKNSGYVADVEITLSNHLAELGRYGEAAGLMGQAIKIKEKLSGPHHASLAGLLDQYAYLLNKTNRQKEASRLQARASQIRG